MLMPLLAAELPPDALRIHALAVTFETACGHGHMAWHVWGQGRPLVLLHGGSGSWTHWIRNVEALAASGRRVLVPDLPGFGDSHVPPGGSDADACVEPLAHGLQRLLDSALPVDLVGFSFGGLVAGLLTDAHPQLVRRLVLAGAPAMGLRDRRLALTDWRDAPDEAGRLAAHRSNLAALMLHDEAVIDDLALHTHAANLRRDRMRGRKLALTDILKRKLPGLQCPVDAIYGREDVLYRHALPQLETVLRTCPTFGELVLVPDAGHWVQYEAAETFNRELLQLLASKD
jgi:pimeloyl-ACP methyl ester carboxylesterase